MKEPGAKARRGQQETRKQQRLTNRAERQQREEENRRRQRRQRWMWAGGSGVALVAVIIAVIFSTRANAAPTIDGIQCNTSEGAVTHIHQHLVIYDRGQPVLVPAGIGIRETSVPACLFWLHTHDTTGVIHVESPTQSTYTLGQFFDIWGQPLSRTRVASITADKNHSVRAYVNGHLYQGDPRTIPLTAHALITLEYGPPWLPPPPFTFPSGE